MRGRDTAEVASNARSRAFSARARSPQLWRVGVPGYGNCSHLQHLARLVVERRAAVEWTFPNELRLGGCRPDGDPGIEVPWPESGQLLSATRAMVRARRPLLLVTRRRRPQPSPHLGERAHRPRMMPDHLPARRVPTGRVYRSAQRVRVNGAWLRARSAPQVSRGQRTARCRRQRESAPPFERVLLWPTRVDARSGSRSYHDDRNYGQRETQHHADGVRRFVERCRIAAHDENR